MEELLFRYVFRQAELQYIDEITELCLTFEHFSLSSNSEIAWVQGRLPEDKYLVTRIKDGIDVRLFKKDNLVHLLGVWICRKADKTGAEAKLKIWPYTLPHG